VPRPKRIINNVIIKKEEEKSGSIWKKIGWVGEVVIRQMKFKKKFFKMKQKISVNTATGISI
jgi:hypothetical protein